MQMQQEKVQRKKMTDLLRPATATTPSATATPTPTNVLANGNIIPQQQRDTPQLERVQRKKMTDLLRPATTTTPPATATRTLNNPITATLASTTPIAVSAGQPVNDFDLAQSATPQYDNVLQPVLQPAHHNISRASSNPDVPTLPSLSPSPHKQDRALSDIDIPNQARLSPSLPHKLDRAATEPVLGSAIAFSSVGNVRSRTLPPVVETRVRPPIISETTRIETITEIQPIIHRDIEAPEVRVIEKHIYETVPSVGPQTITKPAIIEETIRPTIVEEIQPFLHREVPVSVVEEREEHTNERIVIPTVTTREVVTENIRSAPLPQQVAPLPPNQPLVRSHTETTLRESHTKPVLVQETSRPEKITEIQPIIHREIEAPEIHVIEKHTYETVRSAGPSVVTKEPIVEETIHPKIIEEIQPVIHREVPKTFVEHIEQHSNEHITAPTVSTKEVLSEKRTAKPLPSITAKPLPPIPITHTTTVPAQKESVIRDVKVDETSRPEKVVEIQPIIHREVEAPELHVIEKHMYETVPSNTPSVITKQAIVEETVRPKIYEEIRPVLHRDVPAPFVERVEEHSIERVTQPLVKTKEVIDDHNVPYPAGGVSAN